MNLFSCKSMEDIRRELRDRRTNGFRTLARNLRGEWEWEVKGQNIKECAHFARVR